MHSDNIRSLRRNGPAVSQGSRIRCMLRTGDGEYPAILRRVSAAGAFVETSPVIGIDDDVVLLHPEAGQIRGRAVRLARDGAAIAFTFGEQAATFALAAICAEMTVTES